jgi:hypothetical protein
MWSASGWSNPLQAGPYSCSVLDEVHYMQVCVMDHWALVSGLPCEVGERGASWVASWWKHTVVR